MNEKDIKRSLIVLGASAIVLISITFTGAYAYFSATVTKQNEVNKTTTIKTAELSNLTLVGDTVLNNDNMLPGEKSTKSIIIDNPNEFSVCTSLVLDNVTNTFVNKNDVEFSLYEGDTKLKTIVFPDTNESATIDNLSIPANTSKTYKIEISYKLTNEDQTSDMGKKVSGNLKAIPSDKCL